MAFVEDATGKAAYYYHPKDEQKTQIKSLTKEQMLLFELKGDLLFVIEKIDKILPKVS